MVDQECLEVGELEGGVSCFGDGDRHLGDGSFGQKFLELSCEFAVLLSPGLEVRVEMRPAEAFDFEVVFDGGDAAEIGDGGWFQVVADAS